MELRSPRMERVLQVLIERGNPSTKEIEDLACVASARDYIRRLRQHGYKIETIEEGINANGARIVRYRLLDRTPSAPVHVANPLTYPDPPYKDGELFPA